MSELKTVIANNIQFLRKKYPLTQAELAEKLNYSDKAVSKWERGESIPDIEILCRIAELFEVSIDYLVNEHTEEEKIPPVKKLLRQNKWIISLLSVMLVWVLTTVSVIVLNYCVEKFPYIWLIILGGAIISVIVALVFNSIWGNRKINYLFVSLIMWGCLFIVYFLLIKSYPVFFFIGLPCQIIIILWSFLIFRKKP